MSWQPDKSKCTAWKTCLNYKSFNACIGGRDAKDIKESNHCNAGMWVE